MAMQARQVGQCSPGPPLQGEGELVPEERDAVVTVKPVAPRQGHMRVALTVRNANQAAEPQPARHLKRSSTVTPTSETSTFTATDPRTGSAMGSSYRDATPSEIAHVVARAAEAFPALRDLPGAARADLLRAAATALEELGDQLIELADAETGLGTARLTGERSRTCGQLRLFADLLDEGSYVEAIIDHADGAATPPRPDLRRMLTPIGPVAVFAASNFPLAFSVPGGDTASALAAGCPVVVKAHPAHPGTSELCAQALSRAVAQADLPAGGFSLLHGGHGVGEALVTAPAIRAVGFTGSLTGGRALFDLAAARPDPIPVYAEMGSLNPVFVTAAALEARGSEIASGFVESMTLGTGQFCTKPGILVLPAGDAGDAFIAGVATAISSTAAGVMLAPGLKDALSQRLAETLALDGVEVVAWGGDGDAAGVRHPAVVLTVDADRFVSTPQLREEHFGPVAVLVRCATPEQMREVASQLPGGLTATLHAQAEDSPEITELVALLRERVGRLAFDGFPTGVAVSHAMHHGGPYPATTAAGHTSVGSTAIRRFLRPVTYQNAPSTLLPTALQENNPLGIRRLVDGRWT